MKPTISAISTFTFVFSITLIGLYAIGSPGNGGITNPIIGSIVILCYFISIILNLPVIALMTFLDVPETPYYNMAGLISSSLLWAAIAYFLAVNSREDKIT